MAGYRAFIAYLLFVHRQRRATYDSAWGLSAQQVRTGYVFVVLAGLMAWAGLWLAGALGLPGDEGGLLLGLFSLLGLLFFPRPILRQVQFLTEGKGPSEARFKWLERILGRWELPLRSRLQRKAAVGLRTQRR
jgi:hypothetical protein